jgi:hypothetical protein
LTGVGVGTRVGGYHDRHSFVFGFLGFVFALLPYHVRDGDQEFSPYVALVVPYWFLTVATALLALRSLGWRSRRRPRPEGQARGGVRP